MSSESADELDAVETTASSSSDTVQTPETDDSMFSPSIRRFPWIGAGAAGGATFVVQYVVVASLIVLHPALSTSADTILEQIKSYGLILFNAHNVPIVVVENGVTYRGPNRFNMITGASDPVVPAVVYLAIPVVVLLLAGAAFEWYRKNTEDGLLEGIAIVGVGFVPGYLLVALAATFLVATTTYFEPGSVTEGVDRLFAVAAGMAYPLVAASVGAFAVRAYRTYVA